RHKKCIGTFQILNKKSGSFDVEDQEQLKSVANYVTIALENAKLYEDLKVLDKAKERVINHLSHELKTPLAIASGVLAKVERETQKVSGLHLEETLKRGTRQLQRLLNLQVKIDDILNQRPVMEQQRILNIIENSADLVETFKDQSPANQAEIMKGIADRIASLFSADDIQPEWLPLAPLLDDLLQTARSAMGARELELILNMEAVGQIHMDRRIVEKVIGGIIRNAIEHTPDEGRIVMGAEKTAEGIRVWVRDHGVGITPANKAFIFSGFFHTMDTDLYASRRPYAFNAGGTGADLLRTKVFSERFGFSVDFESRRCGFIPEDRDVCPGRISKCRFITDRKGCLSSGGSVFSVYFPHELSRFS
ncbi:MAG: GAF domain-containing sensor histidine kinase, partial [Thermodesulfobacteriota bacterium]